MCDHICPLTNTCDEDKPESLALHVCDHQLCIQCFQIYIRRAIEREEITIRCPLNELCPGIVSYYDIRRVDPSLAEQYTTMIRDTVSHRSAPPDWFKENVGDGWIDYKPIQCPNCNIWLYRNEGCEVIYCICGFTFCSGCMMMYVGCRCT